MNKKTAFIGFLPGAFVLLAFAASGLLEVGPSLVVFLAFTVGALWLHQEFKTVKAPPKPEPQKKATSELNWKLLNGVPTPIILVDNHRKVQVANKKAREDFGGGMESRDLGHSIRHPKVLSAVGDALTTGAGRALEVTLPGKVERTYIVDTAPVGNDDGHIEAIMLTLHDVTAVKVAENLRADFVANVSHELRTPLASLVGFIETLQNDVSAEVEVRERFLSIMAQEAGRMSRLIDDLLSLSKVEVNEHVRPDGKVDLEAVLEDVVSALDQKAAARNMTLVIDCPSNLPKIAADKDQVTQVFQNLITNSLSYGRENTAVTLKVETLASMAGSPNGGIQVHVVDQGDGITPEHLARLTERFYRVDKARSRNVGGTGLCLAIVKHIISRHRGTLNIESKSGIGSTFSVRLPRA
jgi:two-component system phosphate regulon sensor histidine kinase PhoR